MLVELIIVSVLFSVIGLPLVLITMLLELSTKPLSPCTKLWDEGTSPTEYLDLRARLDATRGIRSK